MSLDIVLHPHDILTRQSNELALGEVNTDKFKRLVSEMFATMYRLGGIGLAAPQVGLNARVIVLNPTGKRDYHKSAAMCLINPTFIALEGSVTLDEGCLSAPGIYAPVTRPDSIHVKSLLPSGKALTFTTSGLISRIIQHEIDHLDGLMFLDRLDIEAREKITLQVEEHLRRVDRIREEQEKERLKKEAKEKKRQKDKERLKNKRRGKHGNWQDIFD
jgi:peptide deformylase